MIPKGYDEGYMNGDDNLEDFKNPMHAILPHLSSYQNIRSIPLVLIKLSLSFLISLYLERWFMRYLFSSYYSLGSKNRF